MNNYFIKPEAEQAKVFYTIKPLEWKKLKDGNFLAVRDEYRYRIEIYSDGCFCYFSEECFAVKDTPEGARLRCLSHYEQQLLQHLTPAITLDKPAN